LLDDVQTSGYYHVSPPGGGDGWIYRTYIRRHRGDPPAESAPASTTAGSGAEGAGTAAAGGPKKFAPACDMPFPMPVEAQGIDRTCGPDGSNKASNTGAAKALSPENRAQNQAKNNLCATGSPLTLALADFKQLQKAVDDDSAIEYGSPGKLPADRNALKGMVKMGSKKVGEGTLVRYVGYVNHPRNSNVSGGETVNCKQTGKDNNDIHVDILQAPMEPVCRSVTVEIIPHFRPGVYSVDVLTQFKERPMRFTGQLFFDGAHRPCKNDTDTVKPSRTAVWEIHPVYAIDVCKSDKLAQCKADVEANWVPLHQLANETNEQDDGE